MTTLATHIPRTLIADDQPDVLAALRLLLKTEGYQTEAANSPQAVLEAIQERKFDVVLIDLNYARDTTSGKEGLDLISRIHAQDKSLPIVVMTAWGTVDLAVEAMRRGVRDFIEKPWENSRLLKILRTQVEQGRMQRRLRQAASSRKQLDRELQFELREAREIQNGLMPTTMPALEGFELSCAWQAARTIGGDYVGAFSLGRDRAALCVADVAGKGLPAALMMSNMQAALKSAVRENAEPRDVCSRLNSLMYTNVPLNKFITCFYGLLDVCQRVLRYTNAGHNSPMVVSKTGKISRLEDGGRVLGAFTDSHYSEGSIKLQAGDRLLLFTDGVIEALDASGEEFGESRLQELLIKERGRSAPELQSVVMSAVTEFCGHRLEDDAALMVVAVH